MLAADITSINQMMKRTDRLFNQTEHTEPSIDNIPVNLPTTAQLQKEIDLLKKQLRVARQQSAQLSAELEKLAEKFAVDKK